MANISDLIKAGVIAAGSEIVWNRRVSRTSHSATINANGTITTADGKVHKTPSGAAKHLNDNKPVDGWIAWKMKSTNESIGELRLRLN